MRCRWRRRCIHAWRIVTEGGGAARRRALAPRRAQVRYCRVVVLETRHDRPILHRAHLHLGTNITEPRVHQFEAVLVLRASIIKASSFSCFSSSSSSSSQRIDRLSPCEESTCHSRLACLYMRLRASLELSGPHVLLIFRFHNLLTAMSFVIYLILIAITPKKQSRQDHVRRSSFLLRE